MTTLQLKRFRVTNFRSVDDSGWIETDDVTALIGANESGKTNVLLPLWKLNPAKGGAIVPTADFPRKHYNKLRSEKPSPVFMCAVFGTDEALSEELAQKTGMSADVFCEVEISRRLNGEYLVDFPQVTLQSSVDGSEILAILNNAKRAIVDVSALKTEERLKQTFVSALQAAIELIPDGCSVDGKGVLDVLESLKKIKIDSAPKTGKTVLRYRQLLDEIQMLYERVSRVHPRHVREVTDLAVNRMPKFVYYSTYGNLDSEIYLPHVIENMERSNLGQKEQAKARTLRVLFEFVQLQPKEILELGQDFLDPNRQPSEQEITAIAERKKERSILLQSASALLTSEFRAWWKQGEYRFQFEADGDHFRIWVSDDRRPEAVELEGRSTGLQWFLSFYLVFLVERADAHEGAVLLLDEPGLSLHPLAQRDLSEFFNGLAANNQLIYTCHSPFLVDPDRMDRIRKVYVGLDGTSKVSSDLAATDGPGGQKGATYAVYAALGLSVAESLLLGCTPVVVEGPSDQHYLTAIKSLLIASGRLKPVRELVFPPAGGTKGVKAVVSILGSRDDQLPPALLDSDSQGRAMAKELCNGLYADSPDRVIQVEQFTSRPCSEVEDLIPRRIIARELNRWQRGAEVPFSEDDDAADGRPIVGQIEAWAKEHGVELVQPGWKVELAKRVKQGLLADGPTAIDDETLAIWGKLFEAFERAGGTAAAPKVRM